MKKDTGPSALGDLLQGHKVNIKKSPAYEWQDFALRVISELNIPNFKRGSVFKLCKENSKEKVEKAMNETKELCHGQERWKYFFKVMGSL